MGRIADVLRQLVTAGATAEMLVCAVEALEHAREPQAPRRATANDERVWIYVIAVDHPDTDLSKVGVSQHPEHRRATLERERGWNLYLAHTEGPFSRSQAVAIERLAHQSLADIREKGEWFWCSADEAISTVKACRGEARQ